MCQVALDDAEYRFSFVIANDGSESRSGRDSAFPRLHREEPSVGCCSLWFFEPLTMRVSIGVRITEGSGAIQRPVRGPAGVGIALRCQHAYRPKPVVCPMASGATSTVREEGGGDGYFGDGPYGEEVVRT